MNAPNRLPPWINSHEFENGVRWERRPHEAVVLRVKRERELSGVLIPQSALD